MTAPALVCDRCEDTRDVHVREWIGHQGRKVRAKLCEGCWTTVQSEGVDAGDHRTAINAMIEDDFDQFARAELAAWEEREREGRP